MKKGPLRVLVSGACGRMGRAVLAEIAASRAFVPVGGVDVAPGASPTSDFASLLSSADVVVDFSSPSSAASFAAICARAGKPFVTGTTGFKPAQLAALKKAARRVPIFSAPNMSPAVNLTFALAAIAARRLEGFDIHVHEAHHKAKKDAPSGTALRYAASIASARGVTPPVTSVRAGDIVGTHSVLYAGPHESVELTHRAHSRALFAVGALRAAAWVRGRKAGYYDFMDLLGLKGLL